MTIYVFDMDGTLTPPRKPMEADFANRFSSWLDENKAFIATGSDISKVKEQVSEAILDKFSGIYCAMGNDLWYKGEFLYHKDFTPEAELLADLESLRQNSQYPYTFYPNYIEKRTGMLNFSILGRDCPYEERERYSHWDSQNQERLKVSQYLSSRYPQYDFVLGGSISIDIVKKGCGKGQIAKHLRQSYPQETIMFFGDKTFKGGNDYELAQALRQLPNTAVVQVDGPEHVWSILSKELVQAA